MSAPGFERQWSAKLDNRTRGSTGWRTASPRTASRCSCRCRSSPAARTTSTRSTTTPATSSGSAISMRAIPAATAQCPGGMTAGATRIVPLVPPPLAAPAAGGGRAAQSYRSVIGEPGMGVPLEGAAAAAPADLRQRCRAGAPAGAPAVLPRRRGAATRGAGAAPPARAARRAARSRRAARADRAAAVAAADAVRKGPAFPARRPMQIGRGGLGRPSGVVYALSSDGILHVLGLPSGKDIQRPAEFIPANAQVVRHHRGEHDALRHDDRQLRRRAERGVGDRSRERRQTGRVVEEQRRPDRRPSGLRDRRHHPRGRRSRHRDRRRQGQCDRVARSQDPAGERLVHAARRRVRDRPDACSSTAIGTSSPRRPRTAACCSSNAASLGGANHSTPLHASRSPATARSVAGNALATWQELTITPAPAPAPAATTPAPPPAARPPAPPPPPTVTYGTRWILAPTRDRRRRLEGGRDRRIADARTRLGGAEPRGSGNADRRQRRRVRARRPDVRQRRPAAARRRSSTRTRARPARRCGTARPR